MNNIALKNAQKFLREYKIRKLSLDRLTDIITEQGYKIVRFSKLYNDENTETLINELNLSEYVSAYSAFTYADSEFRIVFLEDNISTEEALILLAHEEGHIYNKHFDQAVIAGKNIKDEYEANEFAHGILNQSLNHKIINGIITHKIMSIVVASIVVLTAVGSYTLPIVLDWSDYYVTPTSDRYHTRDCKYVKDKKTRHRLTNAELKDSDYEPCQICLPD